MQNWNFSQLREAITGQDIVYANLSGDLEAMAKNIDETGLTTRIDEPAHPVFNATVYPNPVREELTLSYALSQATEMRIVLFDASGCAVHVFAVRDIQAKGS